MLLLMISKKFAITLLTIMTKKIMKIMVDFVTLNATTGLYYSLNGNENFQA